MDNHDFDIKGSTELPRDSELSSTKQVTGGPRIRNSENVGWTHA